MIDKKQLNFAQPDDFLQAMDYFGGEDFLKNNFPRILHMLYDSKLLHDRYSNGESETKDKNGYSDSYKLFLVPEKDIEVSTDNQKEPICSGIYAMSEMNLTSQRSFLHMSVNISDPSRGKVYYSYAVHDENKSVMKNAQRVSRAMLNYEDVAEAHVHTEFLAVESKNGKAVCRAGVVIRDLGININNLADDVQSVEVSAPLPKNKTGDKIIIVYKDRSDKNAAYSFKNAYKVDDRLVTTFFPFDVSVTLADDLVFDKESPVSMDENFYIALSSSAVKGNNDGGGGEVHFNEAYKAKNITIRAKGNKLMLRFPYAPERFANYWGTDMALSGDIAQGDFDFHLNFQINYYYPGVPECKMSAVIVVSSDGLENVNNSPCVAKVKKSQIQWGCLGKDVRVMTTEGEKLVSELSKGDVLITDKGMSALKQLVTGRSERIIAVGETEENAVQLTEEHAILVKRGIIRASELMPFDELKAADGTWKEIGYLAGMDYNDMVYSPELEESGLIQVNGYWVGDYHTLPEDEPVKVEMAESIDQELMEELRRWSAWKDAEMRRNVNVAEV